MNRGICTCKGDQAEDGDCWMHGDGRGPVTVSLHVVLVEDEIVEVVSAARGFADRMEANMVKHKPLLDRLAREGDCWQCQAIEGGCDRHRVGQVEFYEKEKAVEPLQPEWIEVTTYAGQEVILASGAIESVAVDPDGWTRVRTWSGVWHTVVESPAEIMSLLEVRDVARVVGGF